MAPGQATNSLPATSGQTMASDGFDRVVGAARLEAAGRAQQWRDCELVGAEEPYQQPFAGSPDTGSRSVSSRITSRPSSRLADGRAITTRSRPGLSCSQRRRNHSRMRLFTRFRTTAPPTRRLTVTPSLLPASAASDPRGTDNTTKFLDERRRPCWLMRRKSRELRRRSSRRRRSCTGATTWKKSVRLAACAPLRAGASGPHDQPSFASAPETHGSGAAAPDSADTSASLQGFLLRPRDDPRSPQQRWAPGVQPCERNRVAPRVKEAMITATHTL
jgi:hypothetical protein